MLNIMNTTRSILNTNSLPSSNPLPNGNFITTAKDTLNVNNNTEDIKISQAIKPVLSALVGGITAKLIGPNLKTLSLLSLPFLILATSIFNTLA